MIHIITLVFSSILLHIHLPTAVLTVPGAVGVVVFSLSFQSCNLLFKNLSNSLIIVLLLMSPLFGMFFLSRLMLPPPLSLSESASKPTCTPRHTHLSLTQPPSVLCAAWPFFLYLDTEIGLLFLVLLYLRDPFE